jgi:putative CocE/NonD family hydrolase
MKVGFEKPSADEPAYDEYVSDPSRPVPYRARPIPQGWPGWSKWLVDDQRRTSSRTDVLTYVSDVLTRPLKISGIPEVNLVASTSGTDSDWVVKLIDLYPPEYAAKPEMGGYQLMVSADIFRGRYRESLEFPRALEPDMPLAYNFKLPTANHVFLPGHRIMVQVQSSWFPLYDRNPQKFVENIFRARPEDFQSATQRVYHQSGQASNITLPVVVTQ